MSDFIALSHARHACKLFNNQTLSSQTLHTILEAGRLAPSSFGMEPWKFLVIQDPKLKERIKAVCWDQVQITSCSHLVIILTDQDKAYPDAPYVLEKFRSRGLDKERTDAYITRYREHITATHMTTPLGLVHWMRAQCYIAATAMMYAAASLGVDSCPIEGFEQAPLEALLELEQGRHTVAMLLPLGYKAQETTPKRRNNFELVVEFL